MDKQLLARVQKQAWFHRYPRGLPIGTFIVICLMTIMVVMAIENSDSQRQQLELERNGTETISALQRRLAENTALLRAAGALFESRDRVSPASFAEFSTDLNGNQANPGAIALGWARFIERSRIPELEAELRAGGHAGFRVWSGYGSDAPFVAPITDIEPRTPVNTAALGFDMYAERTRRQAMDQAAQLRRPVATGKVTLFLYRGNPQSAGFLIYMPVFGDGNLKGFVYSAFRAQDFLNSALRLANARQVNTAIYDGPPSPQTLMAELRKDGRIGHSIAQKISFGSRTWTVTTTATRPRSLTTLSKYALATGLIVAALITAMTRLVILRAAQDREALAWQTRQVAIRTTLTRELNHRVKNTLANVLSIAALTRRRTNDLDGFFESFTGRVRALSATHDLLTTSEWSNTLIGDVIRSELAPYSGKVGHQVTMSGPDIKIAPNDALSLGLAIHELVTNATKYGALSDIAGTVTVVWRLASPELAAIEWEERGGPPVRIPTKRGFGRDLLERIVADELKTEVKLDFAPEGLACRLYIPVRNLPPFSLRDADRS